ncbi:hypothetical protein OY671_007925, partial [Metschnikowia pulcherrima]
RMKDSIARIGWRFVSAAFYASAGVSHIVRPAPFSSIMPAWVPAPESVVMSTGWAELSGAIGSVQPVSRGSRRAAGIGSALYAVCVFPSNIHHFASDMAKADHGFGLAYHIPRMVAQPVSVWSASWVANVIDWPFARRKG